jgi:hypothetical protein
MGQVIGGKIFFAHHLCHIVPYKPCNGMFRGLALTLRQPAISVSHRLALSSALDSVGSASRAAKCCGAGGSQHYGRRPPYSAPFPRAARAGGRSAVKRRPISFNGWCGVMPIPSSLRAKPLPVRGLECRCNVSLDLTAMLSARQPAASNRRILYPYALGACRPNPQYLVPVCLGASRPLQIAESCTRMPAGKLADACVRLAGLAATISVCL